MRVGIRLGLSRNSCLIDAEILRMPFPLLASISLSGAEERESEAVAVDKARKETAG